MSNHNKGTAAGMRRHADMIRKKIEGGQSRASLRREMIDQKFIRACSEAHFNMVVRDIMLESAHSGRMPAEGMPDAYRGATISATGPARGDFVDNRFGNDL